MAVRLGWHFSHLDNLRGILADGQLSCDNTVHPGGLLVTETADSGLKAKRRQTNVPIPPGGVLADYVPFYCHPLSPMLLRVATSWNVDYSGGQDPLVFFVVDVLDLAAQGHEMVITNGHPVAFVTEFAEVTALESHVNWSVMRGSDFRDSDAYPDRQRQRQAELLVHSRVPLEGIAGLVCRKDSTRDAVLEILDEEGWDIEVRVRPESYYPGKP